MPLYLFELLLLKNMSYLFKLMLQGNAPYLNQEFIPYAVYGLTLDFPPRKNFFSNTGTPIEFSQSSVFQLTAQTTSGSIFGLSATKDFSFNTGTPIEISQSSVFLSNPLQSHLSQYWFSTKRECPL